MPSTSQRPERAQVAIYVTMETPFRFVQWSDDIVKNSWERMAAADASFAVCSADRSIVSVTLRRPGTLKLGRIAAQKLRKAGDSALLAASWSCAKNSHKSVSRDACACLVSGRSTKDVTRACVERDLLTLSHPHSEQVQTPSPERFCVDAKELEVDGAEVGDDVKVARRKAFGKIREMCASATFLDPRDIDLRSDKVNPTVCDSKSVAIQRVDIVGTGNQHTIGHKALEYCDVSDVNASALLHQVFPRPRAVHGNRYQLASLVAVLIALGTADHEVFDGSWRLGR